MTDALAPGFVVLHYTDLYSSHDMTLPTRAPVSPVPGTVPQYEAWDGNPVAADTMVEAMVTAMLPNVLATTTFVSYDIYSVPVVGEPPVWLYTAFLTSQVGTLVNTGWAKAVQYTMGFRSALGGLARIVFLNTPASNTFGNVIGLSARDADIATEFMLPANAWAARDNGQPIAFTGISIALNKRLRRKYDMI